MSGQAPEVPAEQCGLCGAEVRRLPGGYEPGSCMLPTEDMNGWCDTQRIHYDGDGGVGEPDDEPAPAPEPAPEPMSAADHKAEAERLVAAEARTSQREYEPDEAFDSRRARMLAAAQVHATLFAGMSSTSSAPAAPWGGGPYG